MDLVFLGSGAFGLPTLRALAAGHTVRAVVTQPDRPAGRGGEMTPTPVGAWAASELPGAALLKPEKINEPGVVAAVRGVRADAWVVIAFGQKLGKALLEGVFAINLHASLLPRWRGAAPINAAILAGDAETGNSVITLAERMDAGLVLGRSRRPLDPRLTAGELHDLLAADGPGLVEGVLREKDAGTLRPESQDEARVTMAPKLSRTDGWVDFRASPEECRRRVHGLTPWPGVAVSFRGQPLKVLRVEPGPASGGEAEPGSFVDPATGLLSCGGATLRLLEVHPPGRRAVPWKDFVHGHRVQEGERMIGRDATP